jgi:hypothetical protein
MVAAGPAPSFEEARSRDSASPWGGSVASVAGPGLADATELLPTSLFPSSLVATL